MHRLFISHTESDSGWVERQLIPALTDAGLECHHEALFSLGKPRLLEFEEAIKQSDRILLICSPAYFADESLQIVDLLAARHGEETKSWPVIPIIRHAVELPLWLRILESLDATDQASWPDALTRLCNSLKVGTPQEPKRPRCPYPGMKPFERDSEFPFYGRQDEVGEIIERLRLHPFLAVIGASGSGKSSVVHAGLIPELNRTQLLGEGDWLTSSFRPSEGNHDQTIVGRLEAHLGGQVQDTESAKASVDSFLQVARETSQPNAQQLLLVVDQFEEVYTLQKERDEKYRLNKDDADQFQRALLTLAEVPGCYVVLTVRADFFGDLMESPIWDKGVKDHRFELTTLGDEGMRQAIVQPALDQDVCIDQVLVERLLSEAGSEPGILPFLQETLVLLWGKLRWRYLSALDYESMVKGRRAEFRSGLEVAMAQRADAAISSLPDEEHRLVARRILLRLVQFGEGRLHTRRQQTVAQLSSAHSDDGIFDATLNHLIGGLHKRLGIDSQRTQAELRETRLLTVGDPRAGRRTLDENKNKDEKNIGSDQRSVDIAHDKLITGWPALSDDEKGWIVLRRQAEEMRRDLEGKVERWVDLGRSRFGGGLLDKIELTECDKWIESNEVAEIGEVPELDQLQRVSQQRLWFRRAGVIAIPVLMIVAMGIWVYMESRRADVAQQLADAQLERANEAIRFAKEQERLRQRETEAKEDAGEQTQLALDTFQFLVSEVDNELAGIPEAENARVAIVRETLKKLERIDVAYVKPDVVDRTTMLIQQKLADCYVRLADVASAESPEEEVTVEHALQVYRRAADLGRQMVSTKERSIDAALDCADGLVKLFRCERGNQSHAARKTLNELEALTASLYEEHSQDARVRSKRCEVLGLSADFWWRDFRDTELSRDKAEEALRVAQLDNVKTASETSKRVLASVMIDLGDIDLQQRGTDAVEYYREALKLRLKIEIEEDSPDIAFARARLGDGYRAAEDYQAAIAEYERAMDVYVALYNRSKNNLHRLVSLYFVRRDLGDAQSGLGKLDDAERYYRHAVSDAEMLLEARPGNVNYKVYLSIGLERLGEHLLDAAAAYANPEGMELLKRKLHLDKEIVADNPNPRRRRDLSIAHESLALAFYVQGDHAAAVRHSGKMLEIRAKLRAENSDDAEVQEDFIAALMYSGLLSQLDGPVGRVAVERADRLHNALELAFDVGILPIKNRKLAAKKELERGKLIDFVTAVQFCIRALDNSQNKMLSGFESMRSELFESMVEGIKKYRPDHEELAALKTLFEDLSSDEAADFDDVLEN